MRLPLCLLCLYASTLGGDIVAMVMLYHTGLVGCALFFYDFALTAFFYLLVPFLVFPVYSGEYCHREIISVRANVAGLGVRIVVVMISHRLLVGRTVISLMILLRQGP